MQGAQKDTLFPFDAHVSSPAHSTVQTCFPAIPTAGAFVHKAGSTDNKLACAWSCPNRSLRPPGIALAGFEEGSPALETSIDWPDWLGLLDPVDSRNSPQVNQYQLQKLFEGVTWLVCVALSPTP